MTRRGPALDGNALRTRRTVDRILEAALGLFNENGEGNVTTGMIADSLDMSPGNLYYHFKNKDAIVERLFERFEARIGVDPAPPADAAAAIEDLWLYLHLMLEAIRDYRFLYRNLDDLLTRNRRMRAHFNRIVERKLGTVVALCQGLVEARAMRAGSAEIRTLAVNVLVVATYWLNFRAVQDAHGETSSRDLAAGAYQVLALVAPYLVGDARVHLERLRRSYVD